MATRMSMRRMPEMPAAQPGGSRAVADPADDGGVRQRLLLSAVLLAMAVGGRNRPLDGPASGAEGIPLRL